MAVESFPEVRVAGGPFECGRQHGEQAGDLIRLFVDRMIDDFCRPGQPLGGGEPAPALTREQVFERTMDFLPMYEAFAPHLVEEIRGVAAGARVPLAEALLCNVRGEVRRHSPAQAPDSVGCTAFAIGRSLTAGGEVIAGQNSDQGPLAREVSIVLSVKPDRGPALIVFTHAGEIGYHGFNAAGVAQFANAVPPAGWRPGMPHYLMKRVLLEQTSVGGCLDVFRRARVASAGNYVLADRGGRLLDVELTPGRIGIVEPRGDFIAHANHYEHPDFAHFNAGERRLDHSTCRTARLTHIIRANRRRITVETMQQALRDHGGQPATICAHDPEYMVTAASLVAEVDHGRFHVSYGNPCVSGYTTYVLP